MQSITRVCLSLLLAATASQAYDPQPALLTDISIISRYWGQVSPYVDNPDDYFGVDYVGLPDGCQMVSITIVLQHKSLSFC
jgi:hypothetical protein